ncbi:hypothetical protein GW17_00011987 [Ensete ventricosum]|nr:hypothetical protein GW17_00011987 [Ensete ventricosum]
MPVHTGIPRLSRYGRRNRLPTILPRGRSVSPREEKESPADDSSPTDDESHGQPAINGRRGELLKYDIRYRMRIESLLGWRKGVRQKKTETCRKIIGGSRKACRDSLRDSPKELGSSLGTQREITGKKTGGLAARLLEVARVCGRFDLHPKKIGCGCRCASRRRTRKWT